jgi:hypothetical protein
MLLYKGWRVSGEGESTFPFRVKALSVTLKILTVAATVASERKRHSNIFSIILLSLELTWEKTFT